MCDCAYTKIMRWFNLWIIVSVTVDEGIKMKINSFQILTCDKTISHKIIKCKIEISTDKSVNEANSNSP